MINSNFTIQLSPHQLELLQKGEEISINISIGNINTREEASVLKPVRSELKAPKTRKNVCYPSFMSFFRQQIGRLRANGSERTSETYQATYNKLRLFRQGEDLAASEIDGHMMESMQAFLRGQGLTMNSISFYMRILRAVYHRAVEQGLCEDSHPFTHVFTGSQETAKRALSLKELRRLKRVNLTDEDEIFARDLFLFSFYTRGMSFVDLAYLKKEDVHDGMLIYIRKKTGQRLTMRWEKEMARIVCRHPSVTHYLLPIIHTVGHGERNQYRMLQDKVNRDLKKIAIKAGIKQNLTMYCARHSWATIARERKIPVSVISHAMGHTNEMTTEVYLKALDSAVIDKCNTELIALLEGK